jgi:hypothetical protein
MSYPIMNPEKLQSFSYEVIWEGKNIEMLRKWCKNNIKTKWGILTQVIYHDHWPTRTLRCIVATVKFEDKADATLFTMFKDSID